MTRLIYGFDPLCGWCFGFVPAMRALRRALPGVDVTLALPGLVTGSRVGPYAEMEDYIRSASERLRAVTGRAPSDAFFATIRRPGVLGQSGPPALVLAAARALDPARAIDLAHLLIEAHFTDGADLNDPDTYPSLLQAAGMEFDLPDLHDTAAQRALWQSEAKWGIRSFPTLVLETAAGRQVLPSIYSPGAVVELVRSSVSASLR